ncbi:hypothetical protein JCM10212_005290 [Sporobolomyces blumeae]
MPLFNFIRRRTASTTAGVPVQTCSTSTPCLTINDDDAGRVAFPTLPPLQRPRFAPLRRVSSTLFPSLSTASSRTRAKRSFTSPLTVSTSFFPSSSSSAAASSPLSPTSASSLASTGDLKKIISYPVLQSSTCFSLDARWGIRDLDGGERHKGSTWTSSTCSDSVYSLDEIITLTLCPARTSDAGVADRLDRSHFSSPSASASDGRDSFSPSDESVDLSFSDEGYFVPGHTRPDDYPNQPTVHSSFSTPSRSRVPSLLSTLPQSPLTPATTSFASGPSRREADDDVFGGFSWGPTPPTPTFSINSDSTLESTLYTFPATPRLEGVFLSDSSPASLFCLDSSPISFVRTRRVSMPSFGFRDSLVLSRSSTGPRHVDLDDENEDEDDGDASPSEETRDDTFKLERPPPARQRDASSDAI